MVTGRRVAVANRSTGVAAPRGLGQRCVRVGPGALEAAQGPRRRVDGVRFLDVVGPLDVFTVANQQGDFYSARVATLGAKMSSPRPAIASASASAAL
jgi:hypothetical protein